MNFIVTKCTLPFKHGVHLGSKKRVHSPNDTGRVHTLNDSPVLNTENPW